MIDNMLRDIIRNIVRPIINKASPVQPDQIFGLELWYEIQEANVTKDISDNISEINDLSGNGRHATQGTVGSQYIFFDNEINGNPIARAPSITRNYTFNGNFFGFRDFTIFSVQKRTASGQNIIFAANTENNIVRWEYASDTTFRMTTRSGTAGASTVQPIQAYNASNESFHIMMGTFSQQNGMKLYENGLLVGFDATATVSNIINNASRLGKYAGVTDQWFVGDLATLICYDRLLNSSEINGVLAYLSQTKYGISVSTVS